ncbi:hypothetical protein RIC09_RS26505, partial [Escherichia coli]
LEREDGYIVHQRREWRMYDPETGKLTTKAGTLWGLLKKIHQMQTDCGTFRSHIS